MICSTRVPHPTRLALQDLQRKIIKRHRNIRSASRPTTNQNSHELISRRRRYRSLQIHDLSLTSRELVIEPVYTSLRRSQLKTAVLLNIISSHCDSDVGSKSETLSSGECDVLSQASTSHSIGASDIIDLDEASFVLSAECICLVRCDLGPVVETVAIEIAVANELGRASSD